MNNVIKVWHARFGLLPAACLHVTGRSPAIEIELLSKILAPADGPREEAFIPFSSEMPSHTYLLGLGAESC